MMKGRREFQNKLARLAGAEIAATARKVLYDGSDMIRAEAFQSISRGSQSGKGHVPSAPGEPPNRDAGVLQAHIENKMTGPLEAQVSSSAPYAAALEGGSERKAGKAARSFAGKSSLYGPSKAKHGPVLMEFGDSTTAARPYMRPARDKKADEVQRLFVTEIEKLVRKA